MSILADSHTNSNCVLTQGVFLVRPPVIRAPWPSPTLTIPYCYNDPQAAAAKKVQSPSGEHTAEDETRSGRPRSAQVSGRWTQQPSERSRSKPSMVNAVVDDFVGQIMDIAGNVHRCVLACAARRGIATPPSLHDETSNSSKQPPTNDAHAITPVHPPLWLRPQTIGLATSSGDPRDPVFGLRGPPRGTWHTH